MSTRPKIKKYRIRRGGSLLGDLPQQGLVVATDPSGKSARPLPSHVDEPTAIETPHVAQTPPASNDSSSSGEKRGIIATPKAGGGRVFGIDVSGKAAPTPSKPPAQPSETPAKVKQSTSSASEPESQKETELSEIRKEGLTGRELRMARRMAIRHNITASSDYDAIRQLRKQGIDPFKRKNLMEAVVPGKRGAQPTTTQLPQAITPDKRGVPGPLLNAEADRASAIRQMQQDIARRRRRQIVMLALRLAAFVLLPTIVAGHYYYNIATPLYATHSEFVIQSSEAPSAGSGLSGLLSGSPLEASQDSLTVQSYLQSRAAFQRLDAEEGFINHFSQEDIDPLTRLESDTSNEAAFGKYSQYVIISYDPTVGILKLEVDTVQPEVGIVFSEALIKYAEEVVDNLSQRLREDQMAGARESYEDAEVAMRSAQRKVIDLQEHYNVLSTDLEVSLLSAKIAQLESQLTVEQLSLAELQSNENPNSARVRPLENRIETLERIIASTRSLMTQQNSSGQSLARTASELAIAEAELKTRGLMLQTSLQALESARVNAGIQTRFLAIGVPPIAPDEPTYPRAFENTLLAFLIMSGIYLMLSLTLSVVREQVSS